MVLALYDVSNSTMKTAYMIYMLQITVEIRAAVQTDVFFLQTSTSIPAAHGAVLHLWSVGSLRWSTVARDEGQNSQPEPGSSIRQGRMIRNKGPWRRRRLCLQTFREDQSAKILDENGPFRFSICREVVSLIINYFLSRETALVVPWLVWQPHSRRVLGSNPG